MGYERGGACEKSIGQPDRRSYPVMIKMINL